MQRWYVTAELSLIATLLVGCLDKTSPGTNIVSTTKKEMPAEAHAHTNRLAREKSPYLLQHQHNPVDWYAWGPEAFAKARAENKPIFLSIGYSTCHWCHVMERESFENDESPSYLNEHFVSIKVDREERPDVDKIYMTFVQAMTGQGGWPLNVFLTPDLKPFFGGHVFPTEANVWPAEFPASARSRSTKLWQRSVATTDGFADQTCMSSSSR